MKQILFSSSGTAERERRKERKKELCFFFWIAVNTFTEKNGKQQWEGKKNWIRSNACQTLHISALLLRYFIGETSSRKWLNSLCISGFDSFPTSADQ
jgi:hypothetical protein